MPYVLLKEERDYADEFDTESFIVMSKDTFENYKDITDNNIEKIFKESNSLEMSFGTNEAHFIESGAEYWNSISMIEISDEEFNILKKLFGSINHNIVKFGTNSNFFPIEN